jgi:hypothetical protein
MFCNGAKALMFTNLARAIESYQVAFCKIGNVDVLQVTGYDVNSNIHTDYKVPLSRIEAAYNELING